MPPSPPDPTRQTIWIVAAILAIALIVTGALLIIREPLKGQVREQIAHQRAEVLYGVTLSRLQSDLVDEFTAALEASGIEGTLGVRVFDGAGQPMGAVPVLLTEGDPLKPEFMAAVTANRAWTRFEPQAAAADYFLDAQIESSDAAPRHLPILHAWIPLHTPERPNEILGFAHFLLEGTSLLEEYASLDHSLNRQFLATWIVLLAVVTIILVIAFRRLQQSNQQLSQRTRELLQANHELMLAAKSSAIGAVTAHLIHGLKNPIAGLQQFMSARQSGTSDAGDTEWLTAAETARNMQSQIGEIVRVLNEEHDSVRYELSLDDIGEIIEQKMYPAASGKGIQFETRHAGSGEGAGSFSIPNRDGNLVILILENLLRNAIEACQPGDLVRATITDTPNTISFEVADTGPGIPDALRDKLFQPVQSSKATGGGIGLAISRQLAHHLGATLELATSADAETTFRLSLPKQPAHESGSSR